MRAKKQQAKQERIEQEACRVIARAYAHDLRFAREREEQKSRLLEAQRVKREKARGIVRDFDFEGVLKVLPNYRFIRKFRDRVTRPAALAVLERSKQAPLAKHVLRKAERYVAKVPAASLLDWFHLELHSAISKAQLAQRNYRKQQEWELEERLRKWDEQRSARR